MRFVMRGVARAIRNLRTATNPPPEHRVVSLSPKTVGRFTAPPTTAGGIREGSLTAAWRLFRSWSRPSRLRLSETARIGPPATGNVGLMRVAGGSVESLTARDPSMDG